VAIQLTGEPSAHVSKLALGICAEALTVKSTRETPRIDANLFMSSLSLGGLQIVSAVHSIERLNELVIPSQGIEL
jgi:hypothetical protein